MSPTVAWGPATGLLAFALMWGGVLAAGVLLTAGAETSLWATIVSGAVVVGVMTLWLHHRYGAAGSAWGRRRPSWSDAGWGLVIGLGVLIFDAILGVALEAVAGAPEPFTDPLINSGVPPVLLLLAVAAAVPVVEEYVFRGVLFQGLARRLPMTAAALISGVLFGVGHVWAWDVWGVFPAVSAFVFGLAMAAVLMWRRNLLAPIVAHATVNAVVIGVTLLGPATPGSAPTVAVGAAVCDAAIAAADALDAVQRGEYATSRTIDPAAPGWRAFRSELAQVREVAERSPETEAADLVQSWTTAADDLESAVRSGAEPDFGAVFAGASDWLASCEAAGHGRSSTSGSEPA